MNRPIQNLGIKIYVSGLLRVAPLEIANRASGFDFFGAFFSAHTYNMGTLCHGWHKSMIFGKFAGQVHVFCRRQKMLDRALCTMGGTNKDYLC